MAVRVDDIVGTWLLVHDDFEGLLNIRSPDQRQVAEDPPCSYESWVIDGDYEMWGAPPTRAVRGSFQGQDPYWQVAAPCPESKHIIRFTIDFPGEPPQPFDGYVFTHLRQRMAGFTWWRGLPFGWFATKQGVRPNEWE